MAYQLAEVADLEARAGEPIKQEDHAHADAVLAMSSALVSAYLGTDFIDGSIPDAARLVTVDVAYRVWSNPDGLVGDSVDDTSRRWSERSSTDGFYLTAANKLVLDTLRKPASNRGLWTLGVEKGAAYDGTLYVPTGPPPSGYPFPWYAADDPMLP